jgi:hypothetical protein
MFAEISGFLFLLIIAVLTLASSKYGYEIFSKLDTDAKLQEIDNDPKKFQTGIVLVIFEHVAIIFFATSLFIAFSSYNMMIGIIWLIAHSGEGVIQIFNKRKYWDLPKIVWRYSRIRGAEKETFVDLGHSILKSKNSTFTFAKLLFSLGTLAYSILFAIYGVLPIVIGWFGVIASVLYVLGNALIHLKPNVKALWNLGGLLIWILESVLGGGLLCFSLIL